MTDNEYRPKENSTQQTEKLSSEKKSKKSLDSSKSKLNNPIDTLANRFDKKKTRSILGALITMFSLFLFASCFSYMFTWKIDQDRVLDKGLFEFLFENNPDPVSNWLGKFGAWFSHMFIFKLFGLPSFGMIFLLFTYGIKLLADITLFPLLKTTKEVVLIMIWSSLFLGFFAGFVNFLGGSFGYYLNQWLALSLGRLGSFVLLLVLGYLVLVVLYNPNFKAIFARFFNNEEVSVDEYGLNEKNNENVLTNDLKIINNIRDEDIQAEAISETVHFDDEIEDDLDFDQSELIITTKKPNEEFNDQDFEIEIPDQTDEVKFSKSDNLSIEVSDSKEFEVSDDFDPTLELSGYLLPSIELLKDYGSGGVSIDKQELEGNKNKIVETLAHYKIDISKIKATVGPTVTLYEIIPAPGVRISKIKNLEDDIALSLSALGIRIIAPIPGKGTIGIEVPNSKPEMVSMRSLIASEKFQNFDAELPIVMGKTITNETYTFDLTKMPHLLVAGATGQGKSVGLNAILISILYKKHPAQVKFVLVDPKKVELTLYNKIERHFLAKLPGEEDAIITDTSKVVATLNSLCVAMDERYELLKEAGVRTIIEYNAKFISRRLNPEKGHRYLPYIIVLIDEFADLIMTAGKEVEHPIARIAQLARAIGIHLIVATQRPSVNVITGMIKANFPARIAFRVLSKIDSRTILDASGADQLIGRGDMLIATGSDLKRLQCGFVDTSEVEEICSFIGDQRAYPEALLLPEYVGEGGEGGGDFDMNELDPMFADSARIVVINQQGSASLLQRKLKLGYNRAGRIVDQLEGMNIIGPFQGSKAREVLFSDIESLDEFLRTKGII